MNCPECHSYLKDDAIKCMCGWRAEIKKAVDPQRFRCAYRADGVRCSLPGSCTNSVHGSEEWYCRHHLHALNEKNAAYGRQVIADQIANPPKKEKPWYDQAREDWERKPKPSPANVSAPDGGSEPEAPGTLDAYLHYAASACAIDARDAGGVRPRAVGED